ncbi:MAG: hypothetical protein WAM13_03875 [Candidatus Sulfotelmatobacter sp.]
MKTGIAIMILLGLLVSVGIDAATDPFGQLTSAERALLKPQIERWIHDQLKHDWPDMWETQDQIPKLKNELLLGRNDAPDMDRNEYVQAMRSTVGVGYPEIKAFRLTEVDKEADGFQVVGCAKLQREEWNKITEQYVHLKVANGKILFGLYEGSGRECKL